MAAAQGCQTCYHCCMAGLGQVRVTLCSTLLDRMKMDPCRAVSGDCSCLPSLLPCTQIQDESPSHVKSGERNSFLIKLNMVITKAGRESLLNVGQRHITLSTICSTFCFTSDTFKWKIKILFLFAYFLKRWGEGEDADHIFLPLFLGLLQTYWKDPQRD